MKARNPVRKRSRFDPVDLRHERQEGVGQGLLGGESLSALSLRDRPARRESSRAWTETIRLYRTRPNRGGDASTLSRSLPSASLSPCPAGPRVGNSMMRNGGRSGCRAFSSGIATL